MKRNNLILIGFMGCGKTTVGKCLAEDLGYCFLDTDELIEAEQNKKISDIFEKEGEEAFRRMETELLERLVKEADKTVIATGGGMPVKEENRMLLKKAGIVCFLETEPETVLQRLKQDTVRPLAAGEDREKRLLDLHKFRKPIYRMVADICVKTDGKDCDDIVRELEERTASERKGGAV